MTAKDVEKKDNKLIEESQLVWAMAFFVTVIILCKMPLSII